jgi:hypothetical protein
MREHRRESSNPPQPARDELASPRRALLGGAAGTRGASLLGEVASAAQTPTTAPPEVLQKPTMIPGAPYLLWRNEIIGRDAVMDARTLPQVVMPARDRFVLDNRRGGAEIR